MNTRLDGCVEPSVEDAVTWVLDPPVLGDIDFGKAR